MKALKKEYDEGWDLAISAGLPLAETVDPSKFPDLVYAACVYYKSQNVNLANWRIPAVEPTLSKTEVHRMMENRRLSEAEIEAIARRKVDIFTESEVDDMLTERDPEEKSDFVASFLRTQVQLQVDLNKRELRKRAAASKEVEA